MKKILITDKIHPKCIEILEKNSISVDYKPEIAQENIINIISNYNGMIVRSATKVTEEIILAGENLEIIGRAGTGTENIDIEAASKKGVIVMNTPGGNTISAAEHTISMMMALSRHIAQADKSMKEGLWERKKYSGNEVYEKTLGVIGIGQIGREVVKRAQGLGMYVIGYDPLFPKEFAEELGVTLVDLEDLFISSDIITVHVPLTDSTRNLISADKLKLCKDGVKIINCARGGIVNENDLIKAIDSGKVSGAAFDVFETEPPSNRKFVEHPQIICTPHLGASTDEAQEKVALQIAEQIIDLFHGKEVRGSVNAFDVKYANDATLQPFIKLADCIGSIFSQIAITSYKEVKVELYGSKLLKTSSTLVAACLKGLLEGVTDHPINLINSTFVAEEMGIKIVKAKMEKHKNYSSLISVELTTEAAVRKLAGTVFAKDDIRIVNFDDYPIDFRPKGDLLFYENEDKPGILAKVSENLAQHNINIADLTLGRRDQGEDSRTIIRVDEEVTKGILDQLISIDGVKKVYSVKIK